MADTAILNNLLISTKKMLGKGQAWLVNALNIQEVLKSFLIIPELARSFFIAIAGTPFPALQLGVIPNDQLLQNIEQWEKQFGIIPESSATLTERSAAITAAWVANGLQGRGYLENILRTATGVMVYVRENIPAVDYSSEVTGGTQYGLNQYGEFLVFPPGGKLQYGGDRKTMLLGNGFLFQEDRKKEIVEIPSSTFEWQQIFIIEDATPGNRLSLTLSQLNYLIGFILKYKPVHAVAMLRVDIL